MPRLYDRYVVRIALVLCVLNAAACSSQSTTSEVKHLTPQMPQCPVDQARSASISAALQNVAQGDATSLSNMADNWSMVPQVFTDYVIQRAQAGSFQLQFGGSLGPYIGLTTGGMDGTEPVLMQLSQDPEALRQASSHELGHAVEAFSYRLGNNQASAESANVSAGYQQVMASSDTAAMWSYPETNQYEWFASSFSEYWCSPDTRAFMKETFPVSYSFFKNLYAAIPAAVTGDPTSGGGATGSAAATGTGTTTGGSGTGSAGGLGLGGGNGGVNDTTPGTQAPFYLAISNSAADNSVQIEGSALRIAPGQYFQICEAPVASCAESDWKYLTFTANQNGRNVFKYSGTLTLTDGKPLSIRVMTGTKIETSQVTFSAQ